MSNDTTQTTGMTATEGTKDSNATPVVPVLKLEVVQSTEDEEYPTKTLAELLAMPITKIPCLFDPVFIKSGIAVVVGGSDLGKSSLLRQMCMCVAAERDFLGWEYNGTHHHAIYFSSEDDDILTSKVSKDYNKTMKLIEEATDNVRFFFAINPDNIAEKLKKSLDKEPSDLVIIDAFGDAFNGRSLNDNTEIRRFYGPFKKIAKEYDCLIIFNHHTGKRTSTTAPSKDNSLGSQAIEAASRLTIELCQDPKTDNVIHFCIVKCNYLTSDYKRDSFALSVDNNHVFTPNGERVSIEELKQKKPGEKGKQPEAWSEAEHKSFIRTMEQKTNQTKLAKDIAEHFQVGQKKALDFIGYYTQNGWIKMEKGKHNSCLYSSSAK